MLLHLLKADHADTGLDGLGRQVFQPALRRDAQHDLGSVLAAVGSVSRYSSACRPSRRAVRPSRSSGEAEPGQGLGDLPHDLVQTTGRSRTVHHRANRRDRHRGPGGADTLETASASRRARALPADSAPLSASSRPADRAPSRTAALTSVRIDSAAIAPSGWTAARLKTSVDHETAVDERPGHLARGRRVAPA